MSARRTSSLVAVLAVTAAPSMAEAALVDRGAGLLYNDVLNITWVQDANCAKTFGYCVDEAMGCNAAVTWAEGLVYRDPLRKVDHRDWRLPTVSPVSGADWDCSGSFGGTSDQSYNIFNPLSELAYMYYVNLGLVGQYSPLGVFQPNFGISCIGSYTYGGQADVGLLKNLHSAAYWSVLAGRV